MAHGVFHKVLGAINLSELDLDVREDRLLWESLYGKTVKGDLECLECREQDPGCPQWMFLRLWKGRPVAVHYSTGRRHPTAPESPRHRALKDRIAQAAESAGYSAELEARAPDGRRRTDVLVHGEQGLQLGCEIQLSWATAPAVAKRSEIARSDGISPLWTTDDTVAAGGDGGVRVQQRQAGLRGVQAGQVVVLGVRAGGAPVLDGHAVLVSPTWSAGSWSWPEAERAGPAGAGGAELGRSSPPSKRLPLPGLPTHQQRIAVVRPGRAVGPHP